TGTSLWIDPTTSTYIILLTNAVHVKDGNVIALRTEVATASPLHYNCSPARSRRRGWRGSPATTKRQPPVAAWRSAMARCPTGLTNWRPAILTPCEFPGVRRSRWDW